MYGYVCLFNIKILSQSALGPLLCPILKVVHCAFSIDLFALVKFHPWCLRLTGKRNDWLTACLASRLFGWIVCCLVGGFGWLVGCRRLEVMLQLIDYVLLPSFRREKISPDNSPVFLRTCQRDENTVSMREIFATRPNIKLVDRHSQLLTSLFIYYLLCRIALMK